MVRVDLVPLALAVMFAGTMVVAMAWDLGSYQIPDTLSVLLVVAGVAALMTGGHGWGPLVTHGLGALVVFAFGVGLFSLGYWGGGDAKFMAATSLWLGWPLLAGYIVVVALAGGVLALAVLAFRRLALPASWAARPWLARLHRADAGLPYGVALGCGGLIVLRPAVLSVLGAL